ncbi:MAG: GNAT family N-acetyltransferase, partial [Pseudomonadota bacterium]
HLVVDQCPDQAEGLGPVPLGQFGALLDLDPELGGEGGDRLAAPAGASQAAVGLGGVSALTLHIPVVETERLRLRAPSLDDWPAFDAYFQTPRSVFNGGPQPDWKARYRVFGHIAGQWVLRGYGTFVMEYEGRGIGAVGLWHPRHWPEQEIGWTIWDPALEGQGLAREGAEAAIADAYDRVGLPTLVSYIDPTNARSIALAERLGAALDAAAERPDPDDLVYRHKRPDRLS